MVESAPGEPEHDELIGYQVGAYHIVELVARGGMGRVYRAHQPALQRYVAIKTLLLEHLDLESTGADFQREAELIARLEHPNILPIFDYGRHGRIPYLVMPLIGGGTLFDWDPGPLSDALPVFSRLLSALDYAHGHQVVHLDIKPTNILMGHDGWPLLTDFGLARIVDPHRYSRREVGVFGTPGYMPPEQIEGAEADPRSDLYAMGVILFAILTGALPYESDDVDDLLDLHMRAPIPSPRALNPALAPVWDDVIHYCLAKDPADRYPTARTMDEALRSAWRTIEGTVERPALDTADLLQLADGAARALARHDWAQVIAHCGRILEQDPAHPAATYLLSQAQDQMRRQRAAQLVARGEEAAAAAQYAEARRYYQVALSLVSGLAAARRGLERLAAEDAPGVDDAEAQALPEEATAWYAQGLAAAEHEDWPEAVAAFRQAVVLAPDYRAAVLRLAEAERALAIADDAEDADVAAATPRMDAAVDAGPSARADPARSVEPMPGSVPAPAAAAPGTLLLADGFGSTAFGHLPAESPDPGHFQVEYRRGRYRVTKVDPTWRGMPWVPIPGRYADAALVVDVFFPEGRPGGAAVLCCRAPAGPASGYHLHVAPADGQFALLRWDGGQPTMLVDWSATPSLHAAGETNRLELRCAGTTLGVWLNGTLAATVEDDSYGAGAMWLGADARDGGAATVVLAGLYVVQQ